MASLLLSFVTLEKTPEACVFSGQATYNSRDILSSQGSRKMIKAIKIPFYGLSSEKEETIAVSDKAINVRTLFTKVGNTDMDQNTYILVY